MDHQQKRKSLGQQALLAGVSFVGRDSRPRATGAGASRPNARRIGAVQGYTTPSGRPGGTASAQGSGVPRSRIPSGTRPPVSASSGLSGAAGARTGQARRGNPSGGMTRSNSNANVHAASTSRWPPVATQSKNTIRRSMSMESFGPMSANKSLFATPLNRGVSPGSSIGSTSRPTGAKITKIPAASEKEVISNMVELILTSLSDLGYGVEMTERSFRSLNGKELQNILVFLVSYLLGPNEGKNRKDEVTFIFDGLSQLNSPASISKSALKTLNTQHTLPQVYTVMAWLCSTIGNFENPTSSVVRNLEREGQTDFEQISWDFYKRLFIQTSCGHTSDWDAELHNLRIKLLEANGMDSRVPLAELEEQIQEKTRCLDALVALGDPRADVMQTLKNQEEMSKKAGKRIADLEEQLQKLTDLTAIETEITVARGELDRKRNQLKSMKIAIQNQQITKEKAELLVSEAANNKKQQELIQNMAAELEKKLKKEEKFLENNMQRFYQVCGTFAVVESYNNFAKIWKDKFPLVDANPFDVDKMENWTAEIRTKLGSSLAFLRQEAKKYRDGLRSTDRLLSDLDVQLDALQEEFERKSAELSFHLNEEVGKSEQLHSEIQAAQEKLQAAADTMKALHEEQATLKAEIQVFEAKEDEWSKYLEELTEYNTELEGNVEDQYVAHFAAETEIKCDVQAFVTEARAQVYAPLTELDDPNFQP